MRPRLPPVLVTGCQRSGNTWLGRMLSAGPGTRFIYQPFNGSVTSRPEALHWPFGKHEKFSWVCTANEGAFIRPVSRMLKPAIPVLYPLVELRRAILFRDLGTPASRFRKNAVDIIGSRLRNDRPVIGDPGGIFVATWLTERFGVEAIALHRHPAAIAAGYKRMGWAEDLGEITRQPLLMAGPLAPKAEWLHQTVDRQMSGELDWLDVAVAWWVVFEQLVRSQRHVLHEVFFEDIAADPLRGIHDLYDRLGLRWTSSTADHIARHTQGKNETLGNQTHVLVRDTRSLANAWRHRLDSAEIVRVRELVEPHVDTTWQDRLEWP